MREIKFRGKRLDNGEWIYGDLQIGDGDHIPMIGSVGPCRWVEYIQVHENTIGQFTELKDRNGEDIWEGDIIECIGSDNKPIRHLVRYNDGKGGYSQLMFMDDGFVCELCDGGLISQDYICETGKYIIGNIHDNPELLKTGYPW